MMTRIFLCIGLVFCTACTGDTPATEGDSPAAISGQVVILTSRDEKFMHGLWDKVREAHPELELVVDYGKDAGYLDRMRLEREKCFNSEGPRSPITISARPARMGSIRAGISSASY